MSIPQYPEFLPISLDMRADMYPALNMLKDGISEFTFSSLYLFRSNYDYRVSSIPGQTLIIQGRKDGKSFFCLPCELPEEATLGVLMESHDSLCHLSESQVEKYRIRLEGRGYTVSEDRDNFDYLYSRKDLAELSGKAYHKKRNLVNTFINSYRHEQRPLGPETRTDALAVLEEWRAGKSGDTDYEAAREALELFDELGMTGCVYYVEGSPAAFSLGEPVARARMFAVHFEKGIDRFKGIYQFINQAFAQYLPAQYKTLNREQDLGNEGLRQAKMTYRPTGFVKKYRVTRGR